MSKQFRQKKFVKNICKNQHNYHYLRNSFYYCQHDLFTHLVCNKISKQQEGIALKLNHEQIERSISALEDSAHLICNVQIDPKQLNTSLFSDKEK